MVVSGLLTARILARRASGGHGRGSEWEGAGGRPSGAGGALTAEGTLAVVREMNDSRRMHEKLATLLESGQAKLIRAIVELLYDQITVSAPAEGEE